MLIYWDNGKEYKMHNSTSFLMAIVDTFGASWDSWRLYTSGGALLATKGSDK
jgi:hypothetical protein